MVGSQNGGYLGGYGGYRDRIHKWWDGDAGVTRYVAHVGRRNSAMFRAQRAFFVVLDKDYENKIYVVDFLFPLIKVHTPIVII